VSEAPAPFVFEVLTLFPEMVRQAVSHSILGRAVASGAIAVRVRDIRDHTTDRHRTADDVPYGGGAGMVMKVEPVAKCIREARLGAPGAPVVLMSASGRLFSQADARRYAAGTGLVLVCGHYEGVDERVAEHYVDEEVAIGDYVLSGGEVPALAVLDAVARLLPGVVGNRGSLLEESHEGGMLEYPQYTRPAEFQGRAVPEVLLSGNHGEVARWRKAAARAKTGRNRPDLAAHLPPEPEPKRKGAGKPARLGRPPEGGGR
jgi:tRNA (guanine37-N1)-methyltransferase